MEEGRKLDIARQKANLKGMAENVKNQNKKLLEAKKGENSKDSERRIEKIISQNKEKISKIEEIIKNLEELERTI